MIYKRPTPQIGGWMSLSELQWLYHNAKKYQSIVEIGSWKGRSTHALLSGALQNGGTVTAIDHWQGTEVLRHLCFPEVINADVYHLFMSNLSKFPNLKVLKMSSEEGAKEVESAEMVFIDGDHSKEGLGLDIDLWLPKTTKLLCGHDYNFPEVNKTVVEKLGVPRTIDSIWFFNLEEKADGQIPGECAEGHGL